MRKPIVFALAAAAVLGTGLTLSGRQAEAQGAPPPPAPPAMDRPMPPMMRDGGAGRGGMEERHGGWMRRLREFALIYPARDRNLSGADVQKIAEAFLLFNGNHTWKVTEVAEEPNRVTFALATPDGTAIAHFAMDRHTGRPHRLD